jgi:hypothetical protein
LSSGISSEAHSQRVGKSNISHSTMHHCELLCFIVPVWTTLKVEQLVSDVLGIGTTTQTFRISVTADGFLYKMVRSMVALIVNAGRKRVTPAQTLAILEARSASLVSFPET